MLKIVSDHLGWTFRVVAYGRFDCIVQSTKVAVADNTGYQDFDYPFGKGSLL